MSLCTDQVFLTLYRELYFRHVYARLQPTIDDRFQSYENICELFNYLLSEWREPGELQCGVSEGCGACGVRV